MQLDDALQLVVKALDDPEFQNALETAAARNQEKVRRILSRYPYLVDDARLVKKVKSKVLENLDYYIDQALRSIESTGGHAFLARSGSEAATRVLEVLDSVNGSIVVMSKSMAAEEINLRERLEASGYEVWETDLGQLLIQLAGEKPMHTIAPAVHMSFEKARRLIARLDPSANDASKPEDLVAIARRILREKFYNAAAGISGCNALAADTGSIVTVENEGNIRLVSGLPDTYIVIVPVDKIVPTLEDALRVARVQAAYAGLYPPTYINVTSGPSSTADIEQKRVYGVHGPRNLHVILLDNGRSTSSGILREQMRCVRCGRCQFECPVWVHTGNLWGGSIYGGPMGIGWTAIVESKSLASKLAFLCLGCGRCDEVCPVEIPLSSIIRYLRESYWK